MREPFPLTSVSDRPQRGAKRAVPSAERQQLPRVPGGKALARVYFFYQQRGLLEETETTTTRHATRRRTQSAALLLSTVPPLPSPQRARRGVGRALAPAVDEDVSPYLQAFREAEQLASQPLAPAARAAVVQVGWRPLGPFSIPHGQTYGQGTGSRPAVSGRIVAVAVDPTNPQHLLIGAGGGGIWETLDGGALWAPRTDAQPSLSIGALAFDPNNPTLVYAGTGEGDTRSPLGVGLLRSTDGGTTWALHATQPFQGVAFFDLLVDPLNSQRLLAATTNGLFASTDGGSTWVRRRTPMTFDLSVRVITTGATGSTELLAACRDGLQRSTDNGATWTGVALPGAPTVFSRLEVAHAPSDGGIVYVFGANQLNNGAISRGFLWRRGTSTGGYTAQALPADLEVGQAWYDWHAAVAPHNPNFLYLGAINLHQGVRSAQGSWTWTNLSAKTTGDSIHPDQHAFAFSPNDPNVVYAGNDGGIYRSPNGGVSWQPLNKGLCITEFEFLAQHPTYESWLLAGTQDNGTLRYQGQHLWYLVQDGDGGDCGINTSAPTTCFQSFYGMYLSRSDRGGAWDTWVGVPPPSLRDAQGNDLEGLFYPPVEVLGNVVVKAGQRVYISRNRGTNWETVNLPGVTANASALTIPTANVVYVGTEQGNVFRIQRQAQAWGTPVALTRPRVGFVSDLLVDPTNAQRLWATYSDMTGGHVFRSDNGGVQWTDVSAGLPTIPVNAIEVDPDHPDTVFVAADVGVYRSDNAGAAWRAYNRNLPNALVKDLAFHRGARMLRAATQSRGMWEIPVDLQTQPGVEVYMRDTVVDTGRLTPSLSNVDDPFTTGQQVFWWQSPDIKVDISPFHTPTLGDVDFVVFADDQSMRDNGIEFAVGLRDERPQQNRPARVYVQVHNRGIQDATNVAVKVFTTPAAGTLPDLPANFWSNFPNNTIPATSPWQPIAAHKTLASLAAGRSSTIGFDWTVPATAATNLSLLAIITADNDTISTTEQAVSVLVPQEKKCALKSLTVINPPVTAGPPATAVALHLWPVAQREPVRLRLDGRAPRLIRALVLSKPLAQQAEAAGLSKLRLDQEDTEDLQRLADREPELAEQLELYTAYAGKPAAVWLNALEISGTTPSTIVVLLERQPKSGQQTLVLESASGVPLGGYTFQALP